ncbi:MAG: hypothetical protein B7733_26350 [Myxococcales bacterium FL481]|nr:MAG: hypothetical protein B7733_26350 [Myxococcales bacterium FL481]
MTIPDEPVAPESERPRATAPGEPSATGELTSSAPELQAPRLLAKSGVPPLYLRREYTTHTTTATAFPPLFIHRSPKPGHPDRFFHADLSLTVGWYSRFLEKRRIISPLALFFYGRSEHKTAWGAPLLLMGYKRVGEKYNFGQFPLFWAWGNRHVRNFLAVPFHFQQKTPNSYSAVSALLLWYGHQGIDDHDPTNDRRHFVAFPAYFRVERAKRRFEFSPVYFAGHNQEKGVQHRTLLPFFHWQQREFGNREELWTLPWVHRTDRARERSTWAIPPLLAFSSRTRERELLTVTPLYWRMRDHIQGSQTVVAGLYGSRRDPLQHNRWLAPLWWSSHDKPTDVRTNVVLPLFRSRTSPDRSRVDTPLASWERGSKGSFAFGVHPLLTYVRRDPKRVSHDVVLGGLAYWRRHDLTAVGGPQSTWGVGPLVYGRTQGDRRSVNVWPALSFFGRDGSKRYQVVTPLLWHVTDPQRSRRTIVAGPLYWHRDAAGSNAGLAPLVFAGSGPQRRYAVIPALGFGHVARQQQQDALTVSPLFVRYAAPGRRTLGLGLLAWDVKRPQQRHSVLFPLYYRRQVNDTRLTVTPLGGGFRRGDRSFWLAGPAFGGGDDTSRHAGLFPLFLHQRRHAGEAKGSTTLLFPLFARDRRPARDLDVWTPLIWRSRVRGELPRRGFAAVPFYFRQRQPGGVDVDGGLGWFYSRNRTRRTHTTIVGPAFHRLSRTSLHTGVFPIAWWMDSEQQRRLLSLPLIYHDVDKSTGERTTFAVPLWFDRQRPSGARTWMAFPFVVGRRTNRHDFLRFSLAPPGFIDSFRLRKNRRFTGLFPVLYRYQKCGFVQGDDDACRYTLWGSFPLFAYGRDGQGRRTHSALALYYFDRDPKGMRLYTLLGGAQVRPGERLRWYAGPLYRDTTRTHRTTAFFPLFLHRRHRSIDESTTIVLPPLYIQQHQRDRRWWQAGLVFWQFRKQHQVTTVVAPPVFGHIHAYAERRLTWALPLFYRDNRMGDGKATTVVFPALYMQHRTPERTTAVQFPTVWHFRRPGTRTTIGGFVWYDLERHGNRTQVVPAVLVRRSTPEQTTTVIGPGLAWWQRETLTDAEAEAGVEPERSWRALLGLFGGGRDETGRYASILGARISIGEQREAAPAGDRPAADPTGASAPEAPVPAPEPPASVAPAAPTAPAVPTPESTSPSAPAPTPTPPAPSPTPAALPTAPPAPAPTH